MNLFSKIKNLFSSPSYSRTLALIGLLIIIVALPITIVVLQQRTNTQQHAMVTGDGGGDTCTPGQPDGGIYCCGTNQCQAFYTNTSCAYILRTVATNVASCGYKPPTPTPTHAPNDNNCENTTVKGICEPRQECGAELDLQIDTNSAHACQSKTNGITNVCCVPKPTPPPANKYACTNVIGTIGTQYIDRTTTPEKVVSCPAGTFCNGTSSNDISQICKPLNTVSGCSCNGNNYSCNGGSLKGTCPANQVCKVLGSGQNPCTTYSAANPYPGNVCASQDGHVGVCIYASTPPSGWTTDKFAACYAIGSCNRTLPSCGSIIPGTSDGSDNLVGCNGLGQLSKCCVYDLPNACLLTKQSTTGNVGTNTGNVYNDRCIGTDNGVVEEGFCGYAPLFGNVDSCNNVIKGTHTINANIVGCGHSNLGAPYECCAFNACYTALTSKPLPPYIPPSVTPSPTPIACHNNSGQSGVCVFSNTTPGESHFTTDQAKQCLPTNLLCPDFSCNDYSSGYVDVPTNIGGLDFWNSQCYAGGGAQVRCCAPKSSGTGGSGGSGGGGGGNQPPAPTCTPGQSTSFALAVKLQGIGSGTFENNNPLHPTRTAAYVRVTDESGTKLYDQGNIQFTYSNGTFNASTIDLGTSATCGHTYTVTFKLPMYVKASNAVTYGKTGQPVDINPIPGDINLVTTGGVVVGDDFINVNDYAMFRDNNCHKGIDPNATIPFTTGSTTVNVKCSDLINLFDYQDGGTQGDEWGFNYNLWLKGFFQANGFK